MKLPGLSSQDGPADLPRIRGGVRVSGRAWWAMTPAAAAAALAVDPARGLSADEARSRLAAHGANVLPERAGDGPLRILLRQFHSLIVLVLIAAVVVAWGLGERVDAAVIAAIIVLNAGVGFLQEYRAEHALAALKHMAAPTAHALRDGVLRAVPAAGLVPGDIVEVGAGDRVPADGRLLRAYQLRAQEAALTGESAPVDKRGEDVYAESAQLADRENMLFLGTAAAAGKGRLLVTATGAATELGRIAEMLETTRPGPTPLQRQLDRLGRFLLAVFLVITALVFAAGLARGVAPLEMLLVALSLAVAAIPEGLPAVVTISLALGVRKMARRHALIRRLSAVETLGCASVICSDKTGTLTKDEMTVRAVWCGGRTFEVSGAGYAPEGEFREGGSVVAAAADGELRALLEAAALASSASLVRENGSWTVAGDPTEGALLAAAGKAGLNKEELEEEMPELDEVPFDSERKRMSVLRRTPRGEVLFVKGAPGVVLRLCARTRVAGGERDLTRADAAAALAAAAGFAGRALRVLAVAERPLSGRAQADESDERELTLLGLVAMMDPPRPEAKAAVAECRAAGIRPLMITGDHKDTAAAVARELGIAAAGARVIEGVELDGLDEAGLAAVVAEVDVYARVSAAHKLRIVRAFKARGDVVAMTGDGVNDAPAVHEADIGVAMGRTGTDVTREAAAMVVTDDNFASIVGAIAAGRGIYDNIVKVVFYLLSLNIAELLVVGAGIFIGMRTPGGELVVPLAAVQILWINLVTDGLPALALVADTPDPGVMRRAPRDAAAPIVTLPFFAQMLARGVLVAAGALAACRFGLPLGSEAAQTMTMTALVVFELVWIEPVRARWGQRPLSNPYVVAAVAASLSAQWALLYVPGLRALFGLVPLDAGQWAFIGAGAVAQLLAGWALNRWLPRYFAVRARLRAPRN